MLLVPEVVQGDAAAVGGCRRCRLVVLLERLFGWLHILDDCDFGCSCCASAPWRACCRFVVIGHVVNFRLVVCVRYVNRMST